LLGVPIGMNLALVALAGAAGDTAAFVATGSSTIIVAGSIGLHLRASNRDNERISYLQTTVPTLVTGFDAGTVVNLVPKPSPVVGQVLRQLRPVEAADVVAHPLLSVVPIDRS
jgi:hypothetical protein